MKVDKWAKTAALPLRHDDPEADIHELRMATQKRPHIHPAISDANSMRVE
jgi:hypothetical protein